MSCYFQNRIYHKYSFFSSAYVKCFCNSLFSSSSGEVRLDDASWDGDVKCLHMTRQGHGANCAPIMPMGYNLEGSALYHFAAGMARAWR